MFNTYQYKQQIFSIKFVTIYISNTLACPARVYSNSPVLNESYSKPSPNLFPENF